MPTGSIDVILGSAFFKKHDAIINYKTATIEVTGRDRANKEATATQITSMMAMQATHEEAIPIICAETTRILPGWHHRIPVRPKNRRDDLVGSWGMIQPVSEESRFLTAKGPTRLGSCTTDNTTNWVQISNPSDQAITITKGTVVAAFHKDDEENYEILEWDLDVEERLTQSLE